VKEKFQKKIETKQNERSKKSRIRPDEKENSRAMKELQDNYQINIKIIPVDSPKTTDNYFTTQFHQKKAERSNAKSSVDLKATMNRNK